MNKILIKLKIFIKCLFNSSYRRFRKQYRDLVYYTKLNEKLERSDKNYRDYFNECFGGLNGE